MRTKSTIALVATIALFLVLSISYAPPEYVQFAAVTYYGSA